MSVKLHTVSGCIKLVFREKLAVSRRVGKEEYSEDSEEDRDSPLSKENEWPRIC
jgi:hypothetical protein